MYSNLFGKNFLTWLLYKTNVRKIFKIVDFFQNFFLPRSTVIIVIGLNFWLKIYVPHIRKQVGNKITGSEIFFLPPRCLN